MSKWAQNPNDYYLQYLSDNPLPKEPQTQPMSVGSAFDAYVKSFLHEHIFGKGADARFERDAIFEEQVEKHNWDFARTAGEHCLNWYRHLGALDQLMLDLGKTVGPPRFEMDVRGVASAGRMGEVRGVPFRVKPDLFYVNELGAHVILDWKVNGYCSKGGVSPMKGFVRARRSGKLPWTHDDAVLKGHLGLVVNVARGLEDYDEDWARQCSVGSWMCGEEVGAPFVAVIHQLACRPGESRPSITVAEHACFVHRGYQEQVHKLAVEMWEAINSDWVFRNLTIADSQELCRVLDQRRETLSEGVYNLNPALE